MQTLTRREREVAALIAEGLTDKAIAMRLSASFHTVRAHICNVMVKLRTNKRARVAAIYAAEVAARQAR
jgi:DNA-binding NarL/FixJ family response regulator